MNFVVFAGTNECRSLLAAIDESQEHRLAAAACDSTLRAEFGDFAETIWALSDWQQLIAVSGAEAGIVCGHDQTAQEAARQMAATGWHLMVYPDARQTASFAYRLWPIAVDSSNIMMPVLTHRLDPQWLALRERLQRGDLGNLRYLELSRSEPGGPSGVVDDELVSRRLLHDSDLLRWLCGDYSRVTSLQTGRVANGVASQSVTLAGDGCPEATWSVKASTGEPHWRLTICGESATEVHTSREHSQDAAHDTLTVHRTQEGLGAEVLTEFQRSLEAAAGGNRWVELVRDFDVLDATRRSLRRSRTVEVGSDEFSERSQFKSKMSAAGCGVLMYTMFSLVLVLLAGALLDPRDAAQKRSQAAEFVLSADDFTGESAALSPEGELHVADIRSRLWQTTAEIIIDPADVPSDVTDRRRETVAAKVSETAGPMDEDRVVVRELRGQWFQRGMLIAWILVFLPGGVILLLQGLLLVARPAAGSEPQ